jgi:hypothetical protein
MPDDPVARVSAALQLEPIAHETGVGRFAVERSDNLREIRVWRVLDRVPGTLRKGFARATTVSDVSGGFGGLQPAGALTGVPLRLVVVGQWGTDLPGHCGHPRGRRAPHRAPHQPSGRGPDVRSSPSVVSNGHEVTGSPSMMRGIGHIRRRVPMPTDRHHDGDPATTRIRRRAATSAIRAHHSPTPHAPATSCRLHVDMQGGGNGPKTRET